MSSKRYTWKKKFLLIILTLMLYTVETLLPSIPFGIEGVRLGLNNIFIIYSLNFISIPFAYILLIIKVTLGSIIVGNYNIILYTLISGIFSLVSMHLILKYSNNKFGVIGQSCIGAITNNIVKILFFALVIKSTFILKKIPTILSASVLFGTITGSITYIIRPKTFMKNKKELQGDQL